MAFKANEDDMEFWFTCVCKPPQKSRLSSFVNSLYESVFNEVGTSLESHSNAHGIALKLHITSYPSVVRAGE